MTESPLRAVRLWEPDIDWERRDDGSILVWQNGKLGAYPPRISDRIHHWAEQAPDRTWMAERGPSGEWERVSYAEMLARVRSIGQALLAIGLTARPTAPGWPNAAPRANGSG